MNWGDGEGKKRKLLPQCHQQKKIQKLLLILRISYINFQRTKGTLIKSPLKGACKGFEMHCEEKVTSKTWRQLVHMKCQFHFLEAKFNGHVISLAWVDSFCKLFYNAEELFVTKWQWTDKAWWTFRHRWQFHRYFSPSDSSRYQHQQRAPRTYWWLWENIRATVTLSRLCSSEVLCMVWLPIDG